MTAERISIDRMLELIPGLVHVSWNGFSTKLDGEVRRVRILRPAPGTIDLVLADLKGATPEDMAAATVTGTPPAKGGAPADLFRRGYRSASAPDPHVELVFAQPVRLSAVNLIPQPGIRGVASYDIVVEVEDARGAVIRYSNAAPDKLGRRLRNSERTLNHALKALRKIATGKPALETAVAQIATPARALIEEAAALLAGQGREDAGETHRALVTAIAALPALLQPRELRAVLAHAATVIPPLMRRDHPLGHGGAPDAERTCLAMMFTAKLLKRPSLKRRRHVRDYMTMLRHRADLVEVERLINGFFSRAGGSEQLLPILFRKHGLSGSFLLAEPDRYLDALTAVAESARACGYDAAICYGTLLGAVREKTFIPHDDDVDMAVALHAHDLTAAKAEMSALAGLLAAQGLRAELVRHGLIMQVTPPGQRVKVDLFPIFASDAGAVAMYMEGLKLRDVPRDFVMPLAPVAFYGREYLAPRDPEAFLQNRYGDWRKQVRQIGPDR